MTETSAPVRPDGTPEAPEPGAARPSADPFRADIDGLRALAVVLVVAYHAEVPGFAGGFVGVDVFFVISGYLITRNLLAERARSGRIALLAFWSRRARRLAPALTVVTVATLAASAVVLSPLEWVAAARDSIWSTTYLSNLAFGQRATDYFADGSTSPFLHTWSLSVEEQFYVAWPLLVAVVAGLAARGRAPRARRVLVGGALAAVATTSFALCVLLTERGTPWAFYGLPTRAWQFAAAGVVAAWAPTRTTGRLVGPVLGTAGLVLVVAPTLAYDGLTAYPGTAAAAPTLGTILLIASGGGVARPLLDRALGWPFVQVVGRLSYSWYLWHWPALLLVVAATDRDQLAVRLGAVALALVLAALSFRTVEEPIRRHRRLQASPGRSLAVALAFSLVAVAAAATLHLAAEHQLEKPFYADLQRDAVDRDYRADCTTDDALPSTCVLGAAEGSAVATVVVVGDSHAEAWIPAFVVAADQQGLRILVRARGGCPAPDVRIARQGTRDSSSACEDFRAETARQVRELRPDLVVTSQSTYGTRVLRPDGTSGSPSEAVATWRAATQDLLAAVQVDDTRAAMILMGPNLRFDPVTCIGRAGTVDPCVPSRAEALQDAVAFRAVEVEAAEAAGVPTFDPAVDLCPDGSCELERDGHLTMLDDSHLTATYAATRGPALGRFFAAALRLPSA